METKSRYEVIKELEDQKRALIIERDGFKDQIYAREKQLKNLKRDIEDKEEDLEHFRDSVEERKSTIEDLISSVDASLEKLSSKK